jgi:hypothetical protein
LSGDLGEGFGGLGNTDRDSGYPVRGLIGSLCCDWLGAKDSFEERDLLGANVVGNGGGEGGGSDVGGGPDGDGEHSEE